MTDKKQQLDISQMMGALTGALESNKTKEFSWYRSFSYPDVPDFRLDHVMRFAAASLFSHALNSDDVVYHKSASIKCDILSNFDKNLSSEFAVPNFRKVIQTSNFMFYTSSDSAFSVFIVDNVLDKNLACSVVSLDKSTVDKTISEFKDFYEQVETE